MYQALYRKWRPRTFDDVVGQSHITDTLKNQVRTDRLSHAYLFTGTRGTGKTTCAKILAKAVNCEHPVDGNPCCECSICRGIDDGSIMDVVELDAASNNGVDNVRQLRDEAVFSPATARKRVYIIDEVHMLSVSAFNALLKILEEPPAHLMFILATTELNKVPATILSRCQRHSFKRLDNPSIVGRLQYVAKQESIPLSQEAAELIAGLSEGGMRDALSMLDQCSGREKIDVETVYSALGLASNRFIADLLDCIVRQDSASAIALFEQLWQDGKDPATLLGELSTLLRDLLMRSVAPKGGNALLSGSYDSALLSRFRGRIGAGALVNDLNIIQTALSDLKSGQARTIAELCLITLCEPGLSDTLPMLRARVEKLEQIVRSGARPPSPERAPAPLPDMPEPAEELEAPPPYEETPPPEPEDLPPWAEEPEAPVLSSDENVNPSADPITENEPEPAAETSAGLWEQIRDRLTDQLPIRILRILKNPTEISETRSGSTLLLSMRSDFTRRQVDLPDVTAKLSEIAQEITGAPVTVRFDSGQSASAAGSSGSRLDDLRQFDGFVKFK